MTEPRTDQDLPCDASCLKCGRHPVVVRYYDEGDTFAWTPANLEYSTTILPDKRRWADCEHLVMRCAKCGYAWDELPVDSRPHVTPGPPVQPEPEPEPEPDTNPQEPPEPGPYDCALHKKHRTVSAQDTINAQRDSKKEIVEEVLNRRHDGLRSCEDIARDFFNYFREEADEDEVSGLEVALRDRSRHVREACAEAVILLAQEKSLQWIDPGAAALECRKVKIN